MQWPRLRELVAVLNGAAAAASVGDAQAATLRELVAVRMTAARATAVCLAQSTRLRELVAVGEPATRAVGVATSSGAGMVSKGRGSCSVADTKRAVWNLANVRISQILRVFLATSSCCTIGQTADATLCWVLAWVGCSRCLMASRYRRVAGVSWHVGLVSTAARCSPPRWMPRT